MAQKWNKINKNKTKCAKLQKNSLKFAISAQKESKSVKLQKYIAKLAEWY